MDGRGGESRGGWCGRRVSRETARWARSLTAGCPDARVRDRTRDTRAKGASRDAPVTVILPADMVAWEPEVRLEAPARSRASTSAHDATSCREHVGRETRDLWALGHGAVRSLSFKMGRLFVSEKFRLIVESRQVSDTSRSASLGPPRASRGLGPASAPPPKPPPTPRARRPDAEKAHAVTPPPRCPATTPTAGGSTGRKSSKARPSPAPTTGARTRTARRASTWKAIPARPIRWPSSTSTTTHPQSPDREVRIPRHCCWFPTC